MGCVYLITSPSGKQYVGQTVRSIEERWRGHVWDATNGRSFCRILAKAIRKYGSDSFEHEVLHETDDLDELNRLEEIEIAARKTLSPSGYNLLSGGNNRRPSDETRRRMSKANKTAKADPNLRARMSKKTKELWSGHEYREKVTSRVRKKVTSRVRKAVQSDEHRAAHSVIMAAAFSTPEMRAALSARSKVSNARPEVRKKISESMKKTLAAPEVRAAKSVASKAAWACPKRLERHSAMQNAMQNAANPNVFGQGHVYASMVDAAKAEGVTRGAILYRIRSTSNGSKWWHTIPNHNDPMHDGLEECAAILEWAKANPDHENVPDWAKGFLGAEHIPPITPGRHGAAPDWSARPRSAGV